MHERRDSKFLRYNYSEEIKERCDYAGSRQSILCTPFSGESGSGSISWQLQAPPDPAQSLSATVKKEREQKKKPTPSTPARLIFPQIPQHQFPSLFSHLSFVHTGTSTIICSEPTVYPSMFSGLPSAPVHSSGFAAVSLSTSPRRLNS